MSSSSNQKRLDLLVKWFDDHKIKWNKEALEIREVNGSFGVYAKKNVKKGKTVVKIPKECILSIKTTGIANILDEANLEGGCPLALAVLYEMAQKEASPWYGYLQALPDQGADLPIFWDEEEQAIFRGTEMESAVQNDLDDLEDDYGELIEPILEEHPYIFDRGTNLDDDPYSFDRFIKVSTLISSRAFEVDAYHENALVPFADLFNHRGENEHVHFETEFEVCDACGAPEYCEHEYLTYLEQEEEEKGNDKEEKGEDDGDDEEIEEDEEDWEDEEEEMPMDTELPDLEELEKAGIDFYDVDNDDDEKKDTCDMVVDHNIKKGEEVFNTYGDHPNIALLSKYGFCYDDNKNDYISISEDSIVECCLAISAEILRQENGNDEKEIEKLALERTRPRWEFFLQNEHVLCPSEGDEEEEQIDDYEDDQDGCCSDDGHEHEHGHEHKHEHEHDENDECCGGGSDYDERGMRGRSRPYFINYEGLFEDKVMCLLYVMFVPETTFATFVEDVNNALTYFENLAKNKSKVPSDVKHNVYQVCLALVEYRRLEYLEENEWKPIAEDIKERDKAAGENMRKYYALTCRISEKKIIEKAIDYYSKLIKEHSSTKSKKTCSTKNKTKKMKL